jgi:hypothetical protein
MINLKSVATLALVLAALPAAAQAPTVGGLVQVWYTQMMDSNLRVNSSAKYYNFRSEFKENGFNFRRTELNFKGSVTEGVDYFVMIDPSINTTSADATNSNGSYNPTIFQDAFITYTTSGVQFKIGQFKTLQTYEGNVGSSELLFAERSQLGRVFGDKRDRGAVVSVPFGDPKAFGGKISGGIFNGMSDLASGKAGDTNAAKDYVLRADFNIGTAHTFGAYTLQGSTDQADKGKLVGYTFSGAAANLPVAADVVANKDKTTNMGAFYAYKSGPFQASAEYITGLLGRRNPSVGTNAATTAAGREHLDQKFTGYYFTAGYTFGAHTILARYDMLNYNSGDQWYTAYNPYTNTATAVSPTDYTPKFTETTLGYTYAFNPAKLKAANIKVNYILRSKNFLKPNAAVGQTSEQGGDTLMAAFQVAF